MFGRPVEALFPDLIEDIQDEVMRRAAELEEVCRERDDDTSRRILELLQQMISRASSSDGV